MDDFEVPTAEKPINVTEGSDQPLSVPRDLPSSAAPSLSVTGPPPGMVDNLRRKIGAESGVMGETERRMEEDRGYMRERFNAMGAEREKLRPWNYQEEKAKYETNPIEAFGSFASVFGILASAFTKQPMQNALNASASAMTAIREGNEERYKQAFDAYKNNMKLVETRHGMIQTEFQDAQSLMKTDMALGEAKAKNIATRFGDEQSLLLLNNGMSEEWFKLQEARNKAIASASAASDKIDESQMRKYFFENMKEKYTSQLQPGQQPDPMLLMQLWQKAQGVQPGSPEQDAYFKFITTPKADGGLPTPDEAAKYIHGLRDRGTTGGNTNLTGDRQRAQDVAKYRENLKTSIDPDTGEKYADDRIADMASKYEAKLKAQATPASGNQRDQLASGIQRVDNFLGVTDKVEQLLAKHNLIAGIGGKITRAGETLGNISQLSDATDRAQFARWVAELKEWAPRIMNETRGRPLASEAAQVERIVAGMSAGDTTANTARAYRELKPLIAKIRAGLSERYKGEFDPDKSSPAPAETGGAKPKWQSAPIIQKRSELAPQDSGGEFNPDSMAA